MPNRSHFNTRHRMMNYLRRNGLRHRTDRDYRIPARTSHLAAVSDATEFLKALPENSIQLAICDPPYNLDIATWDRFESYINWAAAWLAELPRILSPTGNAVIFGGFQFQAERRGDLLEIMHYLRRNTSLRLVNLIVWYYKNGMSAHRFFANRHEEIAWYAKTEHYTFNLDDVRIPYDKKRQEEYLRDPRLNPETVKKGKNPTNVWEIPRLNGNSLERVGHPTQKPLEVVRRFVRGLSGPGDIVLDPFAGSGTTCRVAIEEARHSISCDLDPGWMNLLTKHLRNTPTLTSVTYQILSDKEARLHPLYATQQPVPA